MGYWNTAAVALNGINMANSWNAPLPGPSRVDYSSYAPAFSYHRNFNFSDFGVGRYSNSGYGLLSKFPTPTYQSFAPTPINTYKFGLLTSASKTKVRVTGVGSPASVSSSASVGVKSEYAKLSQSAALKQAAGDSRLESIAAGGIGWRVSTADFQNDIMFATAGTTELLNSVVKEIRKKDETFSLTVTSALGTKTSPHRARGHYNVENVKLDFGGQMSKAKAEKVAQQLMATGKFDFANPECDGRTYHIDAQFKKEFLA